METAPDVSRSRKPARKQFIVLYRLFCRVVCKCRSDDVKAL
jgi:hypothetical protein